MISLIYAMDKNRNIGLDGEMPWGNTMKADLQRFKELTAGKTIVMGRKTFESLPSYPYPLPKRNNVILSRDPALAMDVRGKKMLELDAGYNTTMVLPSMEEFFQLAKLSPHQEYFVIGGAQIYEQFMPYADRIYLTRIYAHLEGDTKAPAITGKWDVTDHSLHPSNETNPYAYEFITYERQKAAGE